MGIDFGWSKPLPEVVYGPWLEVFAWFPVTLMDGTWKWFAKVYMREVKNIVFGGTHYQYGTLLDVMKYESH